MPAASGKAGDATASGTAGESVTVPDAQLLFNAEFSKVGGDLVLTGEDGRTFVVHDYFAGERRPTLSTRDGATLSPAVIEALAGPDNPGQYAQAGSVAAASAPIGRVEKASGIVSVVRNGVSITLNVGDPVLKGDVVQTGRDSSLGISFVDGTAFSLSSSARMVLNEMVYDPNSTSNTAVMSLVEGTISFVAGKVAKTGDMRVETPVATMGIRGTAVLVTIESRNGEVTAKHSVLVEENGTTGSFNVYDKRTGALLGTVYQAGQWFTVNANGFGEFSQKTAEDLRIEQSVVQQAFAVAQIAQQIYGINPSPGPGTQPGAGGGGSSGTPQGGTDNGSPRSNGDAVQPQATLIDRTGVDASGRPTETVATVPVPAGPQQITTVTAETAANAAPTIAALTGVATYTGIGQIGSAVANGDLLAGAADPDRDVLTVVSANQQSGRYGDLVIGPDGRYSYQANAAYYALKAGEHRSDPFTYVVSDGHGHSATNTVTIELDGANDAPLAVDDRNTLVPGRAVEAATRAAGVLGNDTDLDAGDTETLSVRAVAGRDGPVSIGLGGPQTVDGLYGHLTMQADGTYRYVADHALGLRVGVAVQDVFTVTVVDRDGLLATSTLTFDVLRGLNTLPVFAGSLVGSVTEDLAPTATGVIVATDLDPGESGFQATTVQTGTYGSFTFDAVAGRWTYALDAAKANPLRAGEVQSDILTVTTIDGTVQAITVTVLGTNDLPVIAGTTIGAAIEDLVTTTSGTLSVIDPDHDESAFQSAFGQTGGYGSFTFDAAAGTWVYTLDHARANSLAEGEIRLDVLTVRTIDGTAHDVTVTITGTNDVPTITGGIISGVAAAPLGSSATAPRTFAGTVTFADVDLADLHSASFVPVGSTGYLGTFTLDGIAEGGGSGSVGYHFTVDPSTILPGNVALTQLYDITIGDGHGGFATQRVTITIPPSGNHPATFSGSFSGSVTEDGAATASGTILVSDVDPGQSSFQSATTQTSHYGTFTFNAGSGTWTYALDNNLANSLAAGETQSDVLTVKSFDGTTQDITVAVHGANDAPTITGGITSGTAAGTAAANLVANGGFETGDFTGWIRTGNLTYTAVDSTAHTGSYGASFGQISTIGYLSQTLQTVAGQSYTLSFWLSNSGGPANSFTVDFDGATLTALTIVDAGPQAFTHYSAVVTATGSSSILAFAFRQDPSFWHIDDVAVAGASGGVLTADGTVAFADVDLIDLHGASFAAAETGYIGTFSLDANVSESGGAGSVGWHFTVDAADIAATAPSRTQDYVVTIADGHGGFATQTVTVTIPAGTGNQAATFGGSDSGAVTEDSITGASGTITVSDVDAGQSGFQSATTQTSQYGTFAFDAGSGTWTYALDHALADGLAAGETQSDVLTVRSMDGTAHDITVTVNGTNDAPVLGGGGSLSYTEGDAAIAVAPSLTIADVDSPMLHGATVTIAAGDYESGEDVLAFTDQHGIHGAFDAATGILTLSGEASVSDYQEALRSVTFAYPNGAAQGPEDRTITVAVDDGEAQNNVSSGLDVIVTVSPAGASEIVVESGSDSMGGASADDPVAATNLVVPTGYTVDTTGWTALASTAGSGGHSYVYVPVNLTWSQARELAQSLGGYLATITSGPENTLVQQTLPSGSAFIGASDAGHEGDWRWVDGPEAATNDGKFWLGTYHTQQDNCGTYVDVLDPSSGGPVGGAYANWGTNTGPIAGEPNNLNNGNENVGEISAQDGTWNDVEDVRGLRHGFVIEFDTAHPAPALYQRPGNDAQSYTYGTLILAIGTGTAVVAFALDNALAATDGLAQGDTPDVAVTLTLTDGSATQQVTTHFTIEGRNDAPTTTTPAAASGSENDPVAVMLAGSDVDGTVDAFVITNIGSGTLYASDMVTEIHVGDHVAATSSGAVVYFMATSAGDYAFDFAAIDNNSVTDAVGATASVHVAAAGSAATPPTATDDHVVTALTGTFEVPDSALLFNDEATSPDTGLRILAVDAGSSATPASTSHVVDPDTRSSHVTLVTYNAGTYDFGYTAEGLPSGSTSPAHVIASTGFAGSAQGLVSPGIDLHGDGGDAILLASNSATETMTGGAGRDVFVLQELPSSGTYNAKVIFDFSSDDAIDISLLLKSTSFDYNESGTFISLDYDVDGNLEIFLDRNQGLAPLKIAEIEDYPTTDPVTIIWDQHHHSSAQQHT